VRQANIKVAIS